MYESLGSHGSNLEYEFRKVMAEKGTCHSNNQISEHVLGTHFTAEDTLMDEMIT